MTNFISSIILGHLLVVYLKVSFTRIYYYNVGHNITCGACARKRNECHDRGMTQFTVTSEPLKRNERHDRGMINWVIYHNDMDFI